MNTTSTPAEDKLVNTALIAATSAAILTLIPIAASQLGVTDALLESPGRVFDSKRVTTSPSAHPFGIPDSLLGIGSYSATLLLACTAPSRPAARALLAAKLIADSGVAGFNVVRQVVTYRKLCTWCTATALCTAVMLLAGRKLVVSEASRLL